MGTTTFDDVIKILAVVAKREGHDDLWWRTDGAYAPVITFWIRCNDLFCWGCADSEEITSERVSAYDRAYQDCKDADDPKKREFLECWGSRLYCCRMRGMRPQKPCYDGFPKALWPLFDACGPERKR